MKLQPANANRSGWALFALLGSLLVGTAAEPGWFDFAPPPDRFSPSSAIDLRGLNEKFAGEHGRIVARDGQFVHARTGRPVRFWGVNGPPRELSGEALRRCARLLAKRGVNLVRVHGSVFDEANGELKPGAVQHLVEVVEAMKAEGIYTHASIYFPLWFKPRPGLSWLDGYDGNQHPFAALMFNPEFERRWQDWWRAVLTAKTSDGTPLWAEPALMGVEVQNEDSFFFWTFSERNVPEPQLARLEKAFGDWLVGKYGSLAAAFRAWGGTTLPRDKPADGRVAFRPLFDLFTHKTPRDRDTAAFLFETQTAFYRRAVKFLRDLGFEGLITASNWTTASPEVFGPLEKLSYTVGDFLDRHGYFGCRLRGPNAAWSIRPGHTYVDRSALRFDAEEPGQPGQFNHPVIDLEYNGKPSMISETTWTRPNRFRSEAPLFYAVYGALQDTDAIVHFALDGVEWQVKPRFWMQPWTLMAPSQMGQFPAAALIYRRGLVRPGAVLAEVTLRIADLKDLHGTPLPQDAAFDELRLKDVPAGTEVKPGQRLDPLIHFAGRTRVTYSETHAAVRLADLAKFVDRTRHTVTSTTGEVTLDYATGLLRLDAPQAQGAAGNLRAAGEIRLRDLAIESPLDNLHLVLVALDGQPLRASRRMLLQVMSEEQTSGWKTVAEDGVQRIENIGHDPWCVRQLEGRVRLLRPDADRLQFTALDPNGEPVKDLPPGGDLRLLPDTIYYLVRRLP